MRQLGKVQISTWVYLLFGCLLAVVPFVYDNLSMLFLIIQIFIFGIFAMSYDLLLGYTGIVSFGHAMFFGVGAYGVSIVLERNEPTLFFLILGILVALGAAAIISFIAGVLTLRLKSHFYAMLTLALAGLFLVAAEKMRSLTGGSDGLIFTIPDFFKDRTNMYLLALISLVVIFFSLRRLTNSPLGRVLVAIRENEQRTMSLGYKIFPYKVIISVISGVVAAFGGVLYALSIRFIDTTVFAVDVTLDALLMTIIGGVGTLIGPIIGAGLIEYAHHFLSELSDVHWIFERWIILFGIVYILVVIFFPMGIAGSIKNMYMKRKHKKEAKVQQKDNQIAS
ncbi:branched-chain amino acid transport system permease protein [Salirhabdus euzebyi]|uniref:Branched-chain amino acid transport system permease protein n=1 Tax=Salirhabdus euzebyi TaxID=394506 RepID=A0A841Q6L7_9BACI|nr:branched-chain amino acid ABC transporter permease [Salirhabdus euzebyi]MBB6454169.1 branched-chain amino acid transport system permease protein [Salirhabdus euzebyi]